MASFHSTREVYQANMNYLLAELHSIRIALHAFIQKLAKDVNLPPMPVVSEVNQDVTVTRWHSLCHKLSLSQFERQLVLLCLGQELAPDFPLLYSYAAETQADYPTLDLALRVFAGHTAYLAPESPLRYWQIIEIQPAQTLVRSPLKIAERVLHYLLGVSTLEPAIADWVKPLTIKNLAVPSYQLLAEKLWQQMQAGDFPLPSLIGSDLAYAEQVVAWLAHHTQRPILYVDLLALPHNRDESVYRRLLEREILLDDYLILVNADVCHDLQVPAERKQQLYNFLDQLNSRFAQSLLIYAAQPLVGHNSLNGFVTLDNLAVAEQVTLWQTYLAEPSQLTSNELTAISQQFSLSWRQIAAAAKQYNTLLQHNPSAGFQDLWQLCQRQLQQHYGDKLRVIKAKTQWQDLVLMDKTQQLLQQIIDQVQYRHKIYYQLGFAKRKSRGFGISVLFTGPSGTGKTTAAELIANQLRLELLHADLSSLTSKYVGETEKNLREVFYLAEKSGAILLFDEADALFGKRSNQMQSSNDRHSNMEISYLLQQMEAYQGLSILTTNIQANMDEAFIRRFRFIVPFSLPTLAQRCAIWQQVFPAEVSLGDIAWDKLAQLELTGANIYTAALNATFLAVAENKPVEMTHIMICIQHEQVKLGKLVDNLDEVLT